MIAETAAIDGIYTLAQTVLNVVMAVCILKLKRRVDGIDFRTASTDNDVAGQHFRIVALESAERADPKRPGWFLDRIAEVQSKPERKAKRAKGAK